MAASGNTNTTRFIRRVIFCCDSSVLTFLRRIASSSCLWSMTSYGYGQYSQDVLLSASTLSALSNSSSALEGIDLEVIEEIIERAPRSATTFPLVYRAYGIVLEEQ